MPTITILAGPNGAGKTTFASRYLADAVAGVAFLNPDEIARSLSAGLSVGERDLQAGRLMLERLDKAVARGADFTLETTLSSRLYARRIPGWRARGYRVALIYLKLPDANASIIRVRQRVAHGGHGVPVSDLLRRYDRSLINLETVYKPLVDEWRVWTGRDGRFELLERSVNGKGA